LYKTKKEVKQAELLHKRNKLRNVIYDELGSQSKMKYRGCCGDVRIRDIADIVIYKSYLIVPVLQEIQMLEDELNADT
jgi:hypothetical protein